QRLGENFGASDRRHQSLPFLSRRAIGSELARLCRRRGDALLEQLDGTARVVGEREHLVELDLRTHAVPLDDTVEPGTAIEAPGVFECLPLVDAAGPTALAPDEVLADQSLHR